MAFSWAPHTAHICTRCNMPWHVLEAPAGHIEPASYVCPDCLERRHAEKVGDKQAKHDAVPYNVIPY